MINIEKKTMDVKLLKTETSNQNYLDKDLKNSIISDQEPDANESLFKDNSNEKGLNEKKQQIGIQYDETPAHIPSKQAIIEENPLKCSLKAEIDNVDVNNNGTR
ncbi:uncharacterized protein LOC129607406 [Condylostylus longicornis]|uniref:uncharacterized protein LOC129607406 n=1 Tax=Condylostylus longicornis TaxID=2530218 RepID=UPI00244E36C5|nr:uncharacterized protein LOC129607406 [Condylostylus longicornis]